MVAQIFGAVAGAASNYVGQVIGNTVERALNRKSIDMTIFTDVDVFDIGMSALEGAVTCGASVAKSLVKKTVCSVVSNAAQAVVDIRPGETSDNVVSINDDPISIGVQTVVSSSCDFVSNSTPTPYKTHTIGRVNTDTNSKSSNKMIQAKRQEAAAEGRSLSSEECRNLVAKKRNDDNRTKNLNKNFNSAYWSATTTCVAALSNTTLYGNH